METGAVLISMRFPSEMAELTMDLASTVAQDHISSAAKHFEVLNIPQRSITDFPYADMPEHKCCG